MPQLRAYRFQLRTSATLDGQLRRMAGGLRWLWNQAIARQQERYKRGERYVGYVEMCKWLTAWRNAQETQWLALSSVSPQQQALKRLDAAYQRFFSKAGGYPQFKAHKRDDPGLRFPHKTHIELDQVNGRIKLPKLGWVRMRFPVAQHDEKPRNHAMRWKKAAPVEGELSNASVRRVGRKWFVSIQVEQSDVMPAAGLAPTLGIDMGLTRFIACSDETTVGPLKALAKQQVRLKRYQRSVARKVKGSCNRKKAVAKLGSLHRKIARQREDWLHKLTTDLADRHPVIAIEDLRVKNMSASAKGTVEQPGKNVKAKAGLNRSILDAAWSKFAQQLEYKLAWRGGQLVKVNPAYTSRTCRICAHECADNRTTQSVFSCVACGHTEHADIHAAKNILAAGHAVWAKGPDACGGVVRRAPVKVRAAPKKQEPPEKALHA